MLYFPLDNHELPETDFTDIACWEPYRITEQSQSLETIASKFLLDAVSSKFLLISQIRPLVRKKESATVFVFSSMSEPT